MTYETRPNPSRSDPTRLRFDGFEIDPEGCQLFRDGREVPLERRAADLLCYLATRPGELVRKDELLWHVWNARTLSESVLSNTIGKVRKALGQGPRDGWPIETVYGRGYRWRASPQTGAPVPTQPRLQLTAAKAEAFVGRQAGLSLLASALDSAAQGCGKLVCIAGDAGVGKTRLLEQLAHRARARGFSVWRGAGYDGAGTPAYWPWVEVLRAARAELSDDAWQRHLPADARAIANLAPEVAPRAGEDAGSPASRFRLFDELTCFLESASRESPRLIVLDDLHWSDPATIELLAYTVRALDGRRECFLLLAAALRDRDPALTAAQLAAIARVERSAVRVPLAGLAVDEVAELVAALRESPVDDPQLAAALHQRTEGNPFFVRQLVELLEREGPGWTAANLDGLQLPAAIREILLQRIAALGPDVRAGLAAAAVVGQAFDVQLLAHVLERSVEDTLALLEPARRAGVIERIDGDRAPHEYGFAHALLRDVLYEELEWTRCGALHAKLARALASRPLDDARHLGEVARHHLLAVPSELGRCIEYCCRAADAARRASGFEAAAELVSRAMRKLASEGGDPETYGELALRLGFDQLCSGDRWTAWQTLERGADLAAEHGHARLLAGFACRMGDWLEAGGDETAALRRLDRALEMIGPGEIGLRATMLARRAKLDPRLESVERIALLDEAENLAAESGEIAVALDVAFCRAHLRDPVRPDFNRAAAARYRALANEHPAANSGMIQQMRGVTADVTDCGAALALGDFAAADRALARWSSAAESFQLNLLRLVVRLVAAGRALADGRLADVEAVLAAASDSVFDTGAPQHALLWYAVLLAEARDELAAFATLELPSATPQLQLSEHQRLVMPVLAAWLYARTARLDAARERLASVSPVELARLPLRYGDVGILCLLAEIHRALDDRAAASCVYAQLAPHAGLNAVGPVYESRGSVAHYLGLLAELRGDRSAAKAHFEQAERAHAAWKMPILLERTRACLGRA